MTSTLKAQATEESYSAPRIKLVESKISSGSSSQLEFATKDTPGMSNTSREEMDAKLSATEARIEATMVRMDAKLDSAMARMDARIDTLGVRLDSAMAVMNAKLDHLPSTWVLVTTVFGAFVATIAAVIGLLSYGGERFDSGSQIATQIMETRSLTDENAKQIRDVSDRLDTLPAKILEAIENRNRVSPAPDNSGGQ
jgi:ABC-type transporter Mla subunit MlaD